MKDIFDLVKATFKEWSEDKASRLAAALSYYTIFSLAPLLIIVIFVASLVFSQTAVEQQLMGQIESVFGTEGADLIGTMITSTREQQGAGLIATIVGIATLLFGATGVFGQLHDALNTIWEVAPAPGRGILATIKDRFVSFTMVLGIGFLLLVSLVLSAALSVLNGVLADLLPGGELLAQAVNLLVSFGVITLLFALIYKILPDVEIAWGDVWIGAAVTAFLFSIGKLLIGLYLGNSSTASAYGAAGSLVVILLWIYYSAQILFLGAEFTQVYARRYGSKILPDEDAIALTEQARAQQGMPHTQLVEETARQEQTQPGVRGGPPVRRPAGTAAGRTPDDNGKSRAGLVGAAVFGLFTLAGVALGIMRGEKNDR